VFIDSPHVFDHTGAPCVAAALKNLPAGRAAHGQGNVRAAKFYCALLTPFHQVQIRPAAKGNHDSRRVIMSCQPVQIEIRQSANHPNAAEIAFDKP
jgi:hypothetical protein